MSFVRALAWSVALGLSAACGSSASKSGGADDDAGNIVVPPLDLDSGIHKTSGDTGVTHVIPDAGTHLGSDSSMTMTPTPEAAPPPADTGTPAGDADVDVVEPALPQNLGAACTSASSCVGGMGGPACLPTDDYWAGGYCSSGCTTSADCGSTGVCAESFFTDENGNPVGVCLLACTSSASCRAGYLCDTTQGPGFCAPQDCRLVPTVCTATEQCNQSTGGCTATALPSGYPATFPAPPQVENAGGSVLASPVLVPLFFNGDTDANATVAQITQFFLGVGATNYWKGLSEYGVGPVAKVTPVMLGVSAPATIDDSTQDSDLQQLLAKFIDDGTGGTPKPTDNTLYILNFPTGTTVTQGGGASCTAFGGYHGDMQLGGTKIAYAVVPRCPGADGLTDLETFTSAASHELLEGCTDPFPDYDPAWSACDETHIFWDEANDGSEAGDMCENDPEAFTYFSDFNFLVQRYWSNAAAKAGHDPCYPAYPGEVYFNASPLLTGSGAFEYEGQNSTVAAAKIAVGASATVPLQLYSDASTAAWTVSISDFGCFESNQTSDALLDITLSGSTCTTVMNSETPCITQQCTGQNGDTVNASIKVLSAGSSANHQVDDSELFVVVVTQGTGMNEIAHLWYGVVVN